MPYRRYYSETAKDHVLTSVSNDTHTRLAVDSHVFKEHVFCVFNKDSRTGVICMHGIILKTFFYIICLRKGQLSVVLIYVFTGCAVRKDLARGNRVVYFCSQVNGCVFTDGTVFTVLYGDLLGTAVIRKDTYFTYDTAAVRLSLVVYRKTDHRNVFAVA